MKSLPPSASATTVALHPSERAALRAAGAGIRWRLWHRAAMLAMPLVAGITLTAHAALTAFVPAAATPQRDTPAATREAVAPVNASPAQGTTGTAELPPEPAVVPVPTRYDSGIVAARPFASARGTSIDRGRALECLTAAIYYEAASESDDGQRAVAQVVLNRVRHPAFPSTVCGVVYQGSERTSGCQFSFACDGAMARVPSRTGWARAARIAAAALVGQVYAPVGLATHYHTYAVTPSWNRTLVMTDAVGAHFFHRWKGYWGTAAAFTSAYRGGEPNPGPHPRAFAPAPLAPITLAALRPAAPVMTAIQPAHAETGAVIASAAADTLPQSTVLDRWKDAGKPLR